MLYAYCDESGHDLKDQYMFIAGWFGNQEQWGRLAVEWKAGLGNKKGFHATAAFRNHKRSKTIADTLGPIPRRCGLTPVMSGVKMSDYWDLVSGTAVEKAAKGYCIALFPLVTETLISTPKDERVEFVFEAQTEYEFWANINLNAVINYDDERFRTTDGHHKLAKWSFLPKQDCMLTQPADYLAFAAMQYHKDPNGIKWQLSKRIIESFADMDFIGNIASRDEIREIVKHVDFSKLY